MISVAFGGGRVRDHFAPSKPRCHFTTPFIYSQPNVRIAIVLTPTIADLRAAEEKTAASIDSTGAACATHAAPKLRSGGRDDVNKIIHLEASRRFRSYAMRGVLRSLIVLFALYAMAAWAQSSVQARETSLSITSEQISDEALEQKSEQAPEQKSEQRQEQTSEKKPEEAPKLDLSSYAPGTIVVETSERKLHLVLADGEVITYPVGVGKAGKSWAGTGAIAGKFIRPAWSPPRRLKLEKPWTPDYIPGGSPKNPMGAAAMTLNVDQYAIHGTNDPGSIGGFVSFGCIRMHNHDILDLYKRVKVGTRVVVLR
jgi:lipoprotein-anchoring transpeptidase ErfK/SrfK